MTVPFPLLSDRFIGENTKLIYDIMFQTEQEKIGGLLMLIDFEKALDSISLKFINKVFSVSLFWPRK